MALTEVRILLIDDDAADARLLELNLDSLATSRFTLERVDRLATALRLLGEATFDVVVLDLNLPDSEGLDTFLRVHEAVEDLPIVVLTGLNNQSMAISAVQAGAQDYLVKGTVDSTPLLRATLYAIERNRMQAELRRLSLSDSLTGLWNRRGFVTLADEQFKLAHRHKKGLLIFNCDLDGLKHINDTFGHAEGDRALIRVAEVLRTTFRDSDIIARVSGDEFSVLAIDAEDAAMLLSRLQCSMNDDNIRGQFAYTLSFSVGVARLGADEEIPLEELMRQADRAMYVQKHRVSTGEPEKKQVIHFSQAA